MIKSSRLSLRDSRTTFSSMQLLIDLSRILKTAPDMEGAFNQSMKLLEARDLRQCLGIVLWNYKSKKWVSINRGASYTCINEREGTTPDQSCWTEEVIFSPRIHLKEGKDIVVRNEASLAGLEDLSMVDALCLPVRVGDQMALSITVRPLHADQLVLQEELLLMSAVCMLLKQWIELRFDPLEFTRIVKNQTPIISYLNALQADDVSIEEILIHRIGEMVTVIATGPLVGKSLYSRIIELAEKGMIRWALSRTKMVQSDAAQVLGINRNTLRAKMKNYGFFRRK